MERSPEILNELYELILANRKLEKQMPNILDNMETKEGLIYTILANPILTKNKDLKLNNSFKILGEKYNINEKYSINRDFNGF